MEKILADTEKRNEHSKNIDELSINEMLVLINNEDQSIAGKIKNEIPHIVKAVEASEQAIRCGGRVIYVGCGTSGRLGVLDASECPPTFGVEANIIIGIIAGGDNALRNAVEGAEDDEKQGKQDLINLQINENDFIIGLAASGRTLYVHGALRYAKEIACKTALILCTKTIQKPDYVDIFIAVDSGPEVLTGSTRMKAGTSQKMVLNMISTATMIRLGKVYGNLMVDLRPSNIKLVDRASRIIMEITDCTYEQAKDALAKAGNKVKEAVLMIQLNIDLQKAKNILENCGGRLSEAMKKGLI